MAPRNGKEAAAQGGKKEASKGARSDAAAKKAAHLAMGLNSAMKKVIGPDVCICTVCLATNMGPPDKCICKAGRSKPEEDGTVNDESALPALMAAGEARCKVASDAKKKAAFIEQQAVGKERAKKHETRGEDITLDEGAIIQGGGNELKQVVPFRLEKLGCKIVKNCIAGVNPTGQAEEHGVKPGWVIGEVNGEVVPADKAKIEKACAKAMKSGELKFGFRVPISETGYIFCCGCDVFQKESAFNPDQLEWGPGVQQCSDCEFATGMGVE